MSEIEKQQSERNFGMNKDKYIIANCPACYLYGNKHGCEDNHDKRGRDTYCELINDCVMKQIVEYCTDQNLKYDTTACDILDILDIREVDDDA